MVEKKKKKLIHRFFDIVGAKARQVGGAVKRKFVTKLKAPVRPMRRKVNITPTHKTNVTPVVHKTPVRVVQTHKVPPVVHKTPVVPVRVGKTHIAVHVQQPQRVNVTPTQSIPKTVDSMVKRFATDVGGTLFTQKRNVSTPLKSGFRVIRQKPQLQPVWKRFGDNPGDKAIIDKSGGLTMQWGQRPMPRQRPKPISALSGGRISLGGEKVFSPKSDLNKSRVAPRYYAQSTLTPKPKHFIRPKTTSPWFKDAEKASMWTHKPKNFQTGVVITQKPLKLDERPFNITNGKKRYQKPNMDVYTISNKIY